MFVQEPQVAWNLGLITIDSSVASILGALGEKAAEEKGSGRLEEMAGATALPVKTPIMTMTKDVWKRAPRR